MQGEKPEGGECGKPRDGASSKMERETNSALISFYNVTTPGQVCVAPPSSQWVLSCIALV